VRRLCNSHFSLRQEHCYLCRRGPIWPDRPEDGLRKLLRALEYSRVGWNG